ncbi:MAG: MBL fold metallo-hydrolase [Chloroflexota bacterium]
MDITWYGINCFRITERGQTTVVTDPFSEETGLAAPRLKTDVVTISHDAPAYNNLDATKGHSYVLAGPGEYEIGGVFLYAVPMHTFDEETNRATYNVAHAIQYGPLTVAHLGRLNHVPNQDVVEQLGEVNVVLMPVGGGDVLNANQAAEVIAMIEPNYIVPMHYDIPGLALPADPVEKFLKAMGVSKVQEADSLRVNATALPEQPQIVLLQQQS